MILAAFDLATVTGFAAGKAGGRPVFGHRDFSGGSAGTVFARFRDWLSWQLDVIGPDWIYAEEPFVGRNAYVTRRLYGFRAHAEEIAHRRDIPLTWVQIKTVTEFFVGQAGMRRDAKKLATIRMAQRYGHNVTDDNESDALAIWYYGEAIRAPHVRRTAGSLFVGA